MGLRDLFELDEEKGLVDTIKLFDCHVEASFGSSEVEAVKDATDILFASVLDSTSKPIIWRLRDIVSSDRIWTDASSTLERSPRPMTVHAERIGQSQSGPSQRLK